MSFTQPAAEPPSRPTAVIPLSSIDASPFNPRKDFDKEGLDELAASIAERGLLENLVVRPKAGGRYELMGGERRFRALQQLKAADAKCNIIEADDAQAMAIQIVENLQRKDLGPLEEAEAFARLQAQDPKTWTPQAIAKAVGKTDRFVQQRIAIATNLAEPLKKDFDAGKLNVEMVRTIAGLPKSLQVRVVDHWAVEEGGADEVRRAIHDIAIPSSRAKFDRALYTGEVLKDGKKELFLNVDQFRQLQTEVARKEVEKLKAEWPEARLIKPEETEKLYLADNTYPYYGGISNTTGRKEPSKYLVPKEKCTAVVWVADNGEIHVAKGVCSAQQITAAATKRDASRSTSSGRGGASTINKAKSEPKEHKTAREAFNAGVAKAAAKDPLFADRLFLFRLACGEMEIGSASYNESRKLAQDAIGKFTVPDYDDEQGRATLWRQIVGLKPAKVREAVLTFVLADVPTWDHYEWQDKPGLLVAVAESLGVTPPAIALPEPPKEKPATKVVTPAKTAPKTAAKAKAKKAPKAKAKKKGGGK